MISLSVQERAEHLEKLIDNMENLDMVSLHADLGIEGQNIIERRFDKGVDPKGKPWKKIKPYFNKDWNEARFPSDIPLKLKTLYKSFSTDPSPQHVLIGTAIDYAKYHTDAPKNNGKARRIIPLREFMGFESDSDIQDLLDVVESHVKDAIQKA